jgi:hypothetical protein
MLLDGIELLYLYTKSLPNTSPTEERSRMLGHQQKPSLLQQARHRIRIKHYSIRTEAAYLRIIRRFRLSHQKRHLRAMRA